MSQITRNRVSHITENGNGTNGHGDVRLMTDEATRPIGSERSTGSERSVTSERSIPDLFRTLSQEGADLVRNELALARAEMFEKLDTYRRGSMGMAVGGVLLLGALMLFVQAVNHGLTALLAQGMDLSIAVWLAPLILCVIIGCAGLAVFKGGKKQITEESLVPEATMRTLKEDSRWAHRKVREVKEEIRHG